MAVTHTRQIILGKLPSRSQLRLQRAYDIWATACLALLISGCSQDPQPQNTASFTNIAYATWRDQEPFYRIFPGDVLDVSAPYAPELNRTVTVQPDGRISLPLIGSVMAADRGVPELANALSQMYSAQLLKPVIYVDVKTPTPLRVFVGGEVAKPGVYDMPGDINALQAVILAGGFTTGAKSSSVLIIRRGLGGRPMMRTADLHSAIFNAASADAVPLRRLDVVYVPRTGLANLGVAIQSLRNVVPIQFSYAVTPNVYSTVP